MAVTPNSRLNLSSVITPFPRYLWLLILAYSMMVAITNWFDARLILIFDIALPPGSVAFPITLLLSDIITEVYGYKHARRAIWTAFFFNLVFLLYGQAILLFPSPPFSANSDALDHLLHTNVRIFCAAFISYLVSEPMNSYIMARLKMISNGEYMGLRFLASTIFAGLIDSTLFALIAFYGVFETHHILSLIFNIWAVKVIIEIAAMPLSVSAAKWLKKKERLDIFDYHTNFSPLGLNVDYQNENNLFNQKDKL